MKTLLTLLAACSLLSTAFAQAPTIEWQTTIGYPGNYTTMANAVDVIPSGGYIVAGRAIDLSKFSGDDYFVARLSATGSVMWQKTYGGSAYDEAFAVRATADGGFVVIGSSYSIDGDKKCFEGTAWLLKLDSAGNLLWQTCYGTGDEDEVHSLQITPDKGYILAGTRPNALLQSDGYWVFKTDSLGVLQWEKFSDGGISNAVGLIPGGGYITGGYYMASQRNYTGSLYCFSDSGKLIGGGAFGGNGKDAIQAVLATTDKYVYAGYEASATGPYYHNHGLEDYWVGSIQYKGGSTKWQKNFGGIGHDFATSIKPGANDTYVVSGYASSTASGDITGGHGARDYWLIAVDTLGNLVWQKMYGGSNDDNAYGMENTPDGGYIIVGYTSSSDGDVTSPRYGHGDAWIVKLSPETLPVTLTNFTAQTKQPNVLLKWQTATEQNSKLFNIQRSTNGRQFTSIGTVAAAGNSNTLRTYNYTDNNALALNELTLYYRIEEMDNDGKKMYSKIVTVGNTSERLAFTLVGNPAHNFINVKANIQTQAAVKISDLSGKIIYTGTKTFYPNSNVAIPAVNLVKGIYLLTIQSKGIKTTMKVLVE